MKKLSPRTTKARTKLLSTAGELFRSQGFHATGLDQILKRSRTPKGSLYHYFPGGKDELAIETVRYMAGAMKQAMAAALSSDSDPLAALGAFIEHTANALSASNFRNGCPIATVTLEVASSQRAIREACQEGFQTLLELLAVHIKRAGLSTARAKALATMVLASLEGSLILSRAQRSVEPITTVARELTILVQSSIVASGAEGRY
jgi:TetR/AcrR family transcriptional regulator, lmrAB and yxaGH operons repressor